MMNQVRIVLSADLPCFFSILLYCSYFSERTNLLPACPYDFGRDCKPPIKADMYLQVNSSVRLDFLQHRLIISWEGQNLLEVSF